MSRHRHDCRIRPGSGVGIVTDENLADGVVDGPTSESPNLIWEVDIQPVVGVIDGDGNAGGKNLPGVITEGGFVVARCQQGREGVVVTQGAVGLEPSGLKQDDDESVVGSRE